MKKSVAEEYGVNKNTISTWIANKIEIFEAYESGQLNSSRKKLKKIGNKDLDEAVFTWFKNARSNNVPVNGIIIKGKALSLEKSLELTNFRASDGWLDKWKRKHNVTFKAVSGEENALTPEMRGSWSGTYLSTILSKYKLKYIYNLKKFDLFYQALPNKSLQYKGERCSDGKHSKVRLTGLAVGNATRKVALICDRNVSQTALFQWCKKFTLWLSSSKKELDEWRFVYRMGERT